MSPKVPSAAVGVTDTPPTKQRFECELCGKTFAHRQGKSRHKKTCSRENVHTAKPEDIPKTTYTPRSKEASKELSKELSKEQNIETHTDSNVANIPNILDTVQCTEKNGENHKNHKNHKIDDDVKYSAETDDEEHKHTPVFFGNENISFATHEYLDKLLVEPYTLVKTFVKDIYFQHNQTVYMTQDTIRILKQKRKSPDKLHWVSMKTQDCLDDMIDRAYMILDIYFTHEGGREKLPEDLQNNYLDFQSFYDDKNQTLRKKLLKDALALLSPKQNHPQHDANWKLTEIQYS